MKAQNVILLLGGNQGQVMATFAAAVAQIEKRAGKLINVSSVYSTKAWGPVPQDDFLNMALEIETTLAPGLLMLRLLEIEKQFGRKRDVKYGPRTLDIDILFFGQRIIHQKHLVVPHPEIQNRRFALIPAAELKPRFMHPVLKKSLSTLLAHCKDPLDVHLWKA